MSYRRTTRFALALVTWDARTGVASAEVRGVASGHARGFPAEVAITRAVRAMR